MPDQVTPATLRRGLRVLGVAIRAEPRVFTVAVIGSALYGLTTVASAWVLGRVTEQVVLPAFREGGATTAALLGAAVAILAVALLKVLGIIARRIYAGIMQFRLQARDRKQVTQQYLRLPLSWHHRHPTGELLSNANADVEAAWMPIAPLPLAVGVLVMLVAAAGAMVLTDLVLAVVGFCIFPAIAVLNLVYQRRISPRATRAQQLRAEVSGVAHESFDGALVVKTLGRESEETARFRTRARELRDANVSVGRIRGLFDPALEAIPNLGVLVVLLVGSVRIEQGAMNAGELVQIAYLFTLLAFPVRALGWVLAELPRSVVGWERVRAVTCATGSLEYGTAELAGDGAAGLEVRDVRFGYGEYPDASPGRDVLRQVSFAVAPGRTVAVVGPTGSGKSTLTELIVRLVDPQAGSVRLDRVDVRSVRRGGIAAATAIVPQQTFIFDETVRGNVALGLPGADEEEVWAALRLAQADEFVRALPDGLDTRVGERGASLSGGQRQRIALARALVRRPRLLLLDDATSSVDPQVEARILAGLRTADLPSTVVVVAYRKATIELADEAIYLERGRVLDRGTHAELLERSSGYRSLVTAYEREEEQRRLLDADAEPTSSAVTL
ncbi:MAG: ATP-binding cassette domain-containing protein [Streptosporangiales bacterium]|nr:ATP-binding cassette domain-containing protein [Streptosporangiales bacterium]